jgi:hypothetical protein
MADTANTIIIAIDIYYIVTKFYSFLIYLLSFENKERN